MSTVIRDETRNTRLILGSKDSSGEIECIAQTDSFSDVVWLYLNEEQAREIVRHLNREFDLGLRG